MVIRSFICFSIISCCSGLTQNVIAQNDKNPNILFCISDDQSFPHASAYGCQWVKTPAFDRVAREGILFTNAFTCNAKCSPSRSSILTGRNSWQLEAAANHVPYFPQKFRSYAECLTENGYHVGYTAKGWAPGDPGSVNGKKRELLGQAWSSLKTIPPAKFISEIDYAANFEAFLADNKEGKPFCFWFGSTEPHRPYEFMAGSGKGSKRPGDVDRVFGFWPDEDTIRQDMLDYAFEIEYFDRQVAEMLRILEKKGLLKNTLIIVTSDNGMPFPRIKGNANLLANHLPLAMMWPEGIKNPGRRMDDFVSFTDFAPTFLEIAGISFHKSRMQEMEGKSLVPVFKQTQKGKFRDFMVIGKERTDLGRPDDQGYPIRGIVTNEYLYLRNYHPERWPAGNPETGYMDCDGSPAKTFILNDRSIHGQNKFWEMNFGKLPPEELYNIQQDRDCLANLAENPAFNSIKQQLILKMIRKLKQDKDPRMSGNGDIFDTYPYSEDNRNFYNRFISGEKLKAGWINPSDIEKTKLN